MAFYAHVGASYSGTGAAALTTFNTLLDDLVADLAAATGAGNANGWSLYDDQRNLQAGPTTMVVGYIFSGGVANAATGGTTLTNASANVSGTYTLFNRDFAQASYTIQLGNNGGANWSTGYVSAVSSATALTLSSTWTPATASNQKTAMARVTAASGGATYGYIVLRCQSQNGHPDFFVRVMRPPSFGDLVRIDVFETWDNVAHTGMNPGPQEIIRCYSTQQTQTTQVAYMVWFLPEVFGFYGGQTPVNNVPGDFFYAGNLSPYRGVSEDPYCLVQACTHQGLSGFGIFQRGAVTAANLPSCGATVNRLVGGYQSLWSPTVQNYPNSITLAPRGFDYMAQATAATADDRGLMQMLGVDAYHGVQANQMIDWLALRGSVRYLKFPVMNPSNQFLNTFPGSDGNTYIMVRTGYPPPFTGLSAPTADIWNNHVLSGFGMAASPLSANQYLGELGYYGSVVMNIFRRFFLLPVNL